MYAVIETGGKQYKVAKNDIILVEKLKAKSGDDVKLSNVLLAKDGNSIHVGSPYVKGAHVICESLGEVRLDKVVAFKYKKRKSEKKKIGHRQAATKLKVKEIAIAKG
ncbi:MAG: 50S ribosomal protein L21 [Candidatus Omnitrophica bacterium]|jgi:large subunit ribosomal protein L21|nr:50S ribosomal protein L21 [Candidatus Omnitrophota bacterium]